MLLSHTRTHAHTPDTPVFKAPDVTSAGILREKKSHNINVTDPEGWAGVWLAVSVCLLPSLGYLLPSGELCCGTIEPPIVPKDRNYSTSHAKLHSKHDENETRIYNQKFMT